MEVVFVSLPSGHIVSDRNTNIHCKHSQVKPGPKFEWTLKEQSKTFLKISSLFIINIFAFVLLSVYLCALCGEKYITINNINYLLNTVQTFFHRSVLPESS